MQWPKRASFYFLMGVDPQVQWMVRSFLRPLIVTPIFFKAWNWQFLDPPNFSLPFLPLLFRLVVKPFFAYIWPNFPILCGILEWDSKCTWPYDIICTCRAHLVTPFNCIWSYSLQIFLCLLVLLHMFFFFFFFFWLENKSFLLNQNNTQTSDGLTI